LHCLVSQAAALPLLLAAESKPLAIELLGQLRFCISWGVAVLLLFLFFLAYVFSSLLVLPCWDGDDPIGQNAKSWSHSLKPILTKAHVEGTR